MDKRQVQFLARVRVNVDIKSGKTKFELPDFGGAKGGASGTVANEVVEEWQATLLHESENWGIITLVWTLEGTASKPKEMCIRDRVDSLDTFKKWISAVIENNGLSKSGIFFIWDEFTEYVANSDEQTILQQLSEFCKVQPFFMLFVVPVSYTHLVTYSLFCLL